MKVGDIEMTLGEILVRLGLDSRGYVDGLREAEGSASKFGGALRKASMFAVAGATAAAAGIGALATKSIFAASEAEEMRGKFAVVFQGMEDDVRDWASTQAEAMGRSQIAFEGYLAETQNMLVGMGSTREEGAELSKQIVELGVDLASFNNLAEDNALASLQSAISGNHNASKALGAVLNENTLAMAMEREQIQGKFQDLSEAEKMQVRYTAIVMQSEDAMGDAVRTSDSFANQMRRLKAGIADTVAELGEELLPTATRFVKYATGALPQARKILSGVFTTIGEVVAKAAQVFEDTILPIIMEFVRIIRDNLPAIRKTFSTVFDSVSRVVSALSDTITNRIIPVIQGVIKFVSDRLPDMEDEFGGVFGRITETVSKAVELILSIINFFIDSAMSFWYVYGDLITSVTASLWDTVSGLFSAALDIINGILDFFIGVFTGDWERMSDGIQRIWEGLWNAIKTIVEGAWNLLRGAFENLGGTIARFFEKLRSDAFVWGMNIMKGLADGIKNLAMAPVNAVKDMASGIGGAVKGFFGISSPSKLMRDYGESISEGLQERIDKVNVDFPLPDMKNVIKQSLTVRHNHSGVLRVEGINDRGQMIDVVSVLMDKMYTEMRQGGVRA